MTSTPAIGTPRVGIDLVPVARVQAMLDRDGGRTVRRMLSPDELQLLVSDDGTWDTVGVAGRLAAKEAVFKLLATTRQTLPWSSIEILRGPGNRPVVRLSGVAAELADAAIISAPDVSISHDGAYAIAVAAAIATITTPPLEGPQ